jgi:hypothetical protein
MTRTLLMLAGLLVAVSSGRAGEVTTNGLGGGPWSDPATWKGNAVPKADDDVVVRKGDVVVFDRDDSGKVTCQKLLLDPKGGLRFKTGGGKLVLAAANGIEAYGPLALDAGKAAGDRFELRLVGPAAENRKVKLMKGGALTARGKPDLPMGAKSVRIVSPTPEGSKDEMPTVIEAETGTTIDLQHAELNEVQVRATGIDNTGAKPGEKVNVVGCLFNGSGGVMLTGCDTPIVTGNTLGDPSPKKYHTYGLYAHACPLAEIRDNRVLGGFQYGIYASHAPDVVVSGNTVAKCATIGIQLSYGVGHAAARNTIRDCGMGMRVIHTDRATIEETSIEGAKTAVWTLNAVAQFTTLRVESLAKDGVAMVCESDGGKTPTEIVLLNCNLKPNQVSITKPKDAKPPADQGVFAMEFLVVKVKDAPADAEVEVKTAGAGEDDPNVRNSPAPLLKGTTPLPQPPGAPITASPVVVRSWSVPLSGKVTPAPEYKVRVLLPSTAPGATRKVVAEATAKPTADWFRPKVDDPAPTLEVTAK